MLALTAVVAVVRVARADQPGLPARGQREDGGPPDRHGRRASTTRSSTSSAPARNVIAACPRTMPFSGRRGDVRAHGPRLGTTVAIAMAGMFVLGFSTSSTASRAGRSRSFACAVAGSVTVLPAVLELLGARIDKGRIPFVPHLGGPTVGAPLLAGRRSSPGAAASTPLMLGRRRIARRACTAGSADCTSQAGRRALAARSEPALATLAKSATAFPSASGRRSSSPWGPAAGSRGEGRYESSKRLALAREIAHRPFTVSGSDRPLGGSIEFPLSRERDNAASKPAISTLRDELVPQTLGRMPGVETAVTGDRGRRRLHAPDEARHRPS